MFLLKKAKNEYIQIKNNFNFQLIAGILKMLLRYRIRRADNMNILWKCTTDKDRWQDKGFLKTTKYNISEAEKANKTIYVDKSICYQILDKTPWGGCFADRGYIAMSKLSNEERMQILSSLFGRDGLNFTSARLPLGNSDFSDTHKSYNECKNDYNMEHFSISSDEKYLLPYIKAAQKIRPNIDFFASPWSPPSWVKKNGSIHGNDDNNTLNFTPEILKAYAKYFVKYLKEYEKQGISISAVTPQNEPTMNTAYASCVWNGEQLNEFIRDYLSPELKNSGLDTEIWLGTFTDSQSALCVPTLNDKKTLDIIRGVCFQWWGAPLADKINKDFDGLRLIQSESKCGNGKNDWAYAEEQFDCFKEFLEAGVRRYYLWNMVLDEKGENTAENPWHQNAPITVHSQTNEISYNPSYYLTKHFSNYIEGGAARINTRGTYTDMLAFLNPDGEIILEVKNATEYAITVAIDFGGEMIVPAIPAHSINTFRLQGNK